jgi:hypothetical protein
MTRNDLENEILGVIETNHCSNIAIIGPKRSGKTSFLNHLKTKVEERNRRFVVFGPVEGVCFFGQDKFRKDIVAWLAEEGLLSSNPDIAQICSVISQSQFWELIQQNVGGDYVQKIIVLLDNVDQTVLGQEQIFDLFSNLRKLCTEWRSDKLSIHFVSIGNWIPESFQDIFFINQCSWPFVPNHNLFYLFDFSPQEMWDWLNQQNISGTVKSFHAQYLWEITAGDLNSASEILRRMGSRFISCDTIFNSAEELVSSQPYAKLLRDRAAQLSKDARFYLGKLLEGYFLDGNNHQSLREELLLSGFIRVDEQTIPSLIRFRNWVIESTIRYHWKYFKEMIPVSVYTEYKELIPPLTYLNRTAYEFICEIENLLRNQVMMRLSIYSKNSHPLMEVYTNQKNDKLIDEFTQATEWYKDRVKNSKYVDTHAALISFRQTKHLLEMINHLIYTEKDPLFLKLKPIRQDLDALKDVRDAVAHNQIITEESYEILLRVRKALYRAFVI